LFIQYSKRYLHVIYYNEKALEESEFLNTEESFHGNYIETVKMMQSEYWDKTDSEYAYTAFDVTGLNVYTVKNNMLFIIRNMRILAYAKMDQLNV
jgi:hypothetical protein